MAPINQNYVVYDQGGHVSPSQDINGYAQTPLVDANQRAFNTPSPSTGTQGNGTAGNPVTITLAALGSGLRYYLSGVLVSWSGASPSSNLQVKDGVTIIFQCQVGFGSNTLGQFDTDFSDPLENTGGNSMTVTQAATASAAFNISIQYLTGP